MSNPYFDHRISSFQFLPLTLVRAAAVNARLNEVSAGFDGVKGDIDLKAPLASPTFTGTVTFNTAAINVTGGTVTIPSPGTVAENSGRAATTAWVQSLLGSLSVGLPAQLTHAGKYLRTDGTSASWQDLPLPTGLGSGLRLAVTTSQAITGLSRILDFTGAPAGTVATLPDATTLPVGTVFTLVGAVSNVGAENAVGELLSGAGGQYLLLEGNAAPAGTWSLISAALAPSALAATLNIVGQTTTLRSVNAAGRGATLAIGSDRVLVVALGTGGVGVEAYVVTASGNAVSLGAVTTVAAAGAVHWIRLLQVTGGYVVAWTTSATAQIQVAGLAVSGTTVTSSAATAIGNAIASSSTLSMVDVAIESNGATIVAAYRRSTTVIEAVAASFSGSAAPLVGAAVTVYTATAAANVFMALAAADTATYTVAFSMADNGVHVAQVRTLTLAGVVMTAGTALSIAGTLLAGNGPIAMRRLTASTALLIGKLLLGTNATAAVATVSSNPPTLGTVLTWCNSGNGLQASGTGNDAANGRLTDMGSGFFFGQVGGEPNGQAATGVFSVSGTTVTLHGSPGTAGSLTTTPEHTRLVDGWAGSRQTASSFAVSPVSAAGVGASLFAPGITSATFTVISGVKPGPIDVHRLQTGKRLMAVTFDTAIRAAVVQYRGNPP